MENQKMMLVGKKKVRKGGWNLMLLGAAAALVALATTVVSLLIYHNSGDIYLDRSRPGFLPDEEEVEQEAENDDDYDFEKTGELTAEALDEYLEKLKIEVDAVDAYEKPFESGALSDEKLGIPKMDS